MNQSFVPSGHNILAEARFEHSIYGPFGTGGFPMVWLLFSWGGREGAHTPAAMNASLLGASARPSLY